MAGKINNFTKEVFLLKLKVKIMKENCLNYVSEPCLYVVQRNSKETSISAFIGRRVKTHFLQRNAPNNNTFEQL